ncbi:MAG: hypothetical protein AAGA28_15410 [Pseudomonadota bacterium]
MKHFVCAAALSLIAAPVLAADTASGDEIRAALSGNTVQGGMTDGSAYTEFYEDGGAIKAEGYGGTWGVEGDQMCFDYGEGKGCWDVRLDGDQVTWVKDGADDGSGTILDGNPSDF